MTDKIIGHLSGYPIVETDMHAPNTGIVWGKPLLDSDVDRMTTWVRMINSGAESIRYAENSLRMAETERFNTGMAFGL